MNYPLHLAFLLPLHSLVALFISEGRSWPITSGTPDPVAEPTDASFGHEFAEEKKCKTFITLSLITHPRPPWALGFITFSYSPGKGSTVLEALACCVFSLARQRLKPFFSFLQNSVSVFLFSIRAQRAKIFGVTSQSASLQTKKWFHYCWLYRHLCFNWVTSKYLTSGREHSISIRIKSLKRGKKILRKKKISDWKGSRSFSHSEITQHGRRLRKQAYCICFPLFDLLPDVCPQGPSVLLQMAALPYFSWLNNIPLCG